MTLQINSLFQNELEKDTRRVERILFLDGPYENLVKIDIFDPRALPVWQNVLELERSLSLGDLRILEKDPLAQFFGSEETLPELYRHHRDQAWEVIKDLVIDEQGHPKGIIFLRQPRGALIAACAQAQGITRQTIYTYLRKYWQYGQMKNALLPAYDHCGGRGQPQTAGTHKLGCPNALAHASGQAKGVVIRCA